MSESRVRENRMHGSMRRREATRAVGPARAVRPRRPPADPTGPDYLSPMTNGSAAAIAARDK
jgi:hypothetical protein